MGQESGQGITGSFAQGLPELQSRCWPGLQTQGRIRFQAPMVVGSIQFLAIFQTEEFHFSAGCWLEAALSFLPWGLLHRTSHNTATYFFKATKGKSPCKMWDRILCIIITEVTIHPLCPLLIKSHRFHVCSRKGDDTMVWMSGSRDHGATSESACPSVWFYYLLFQLVLSWGALFQLWGIFFVILFKEILGGIDRRNLPLGNI